MSTLKRQAIRLLLWVPCASAGMSCMTEAMQQSNRHVRTGEIQANRGNDAAAMAEFQKAIELDPDNATAYNDRGSMRNRVGDLDGALADFDQTLRLDPGHAMAMLNRGLALWDKGSLDQGIAAISGSIERNPRIAQAWLIRGIAFYCKRDWAAALSDFKKADEVDSKYVLLYKIWAYLVARRTGDRAAADTVLRRAVDAWDKTSVDKLWLPTARLLLGDLSESAFLESAKELPPKFAQDWTCVFTFYAGSKRLLDGDPAGAALLFRQSVETRSFSMTELRAAREALRELEKTSTSPK